MSMTATVDAVDIIQRGGVRVEIRVRRLREFRLRIAVVRCLLWLVAKVAPMRVEVDWVERPRGKP